MDDINIYNDSAIILNKKTPRSIISWITILFILLILMIILFSIPFNKYKTLNGYVVNKGNNSYLNLVMKESDFPVYKNKKLYIKGNKYNYKIVEINNKEVILEINLKNDINIHNNILEVNILIDRTTVFNILKNKIKKGFGL